MNVAINLSSDEIDRLRLATAVKDDAEAVTKAAREYLRLLRLRELKTVSGRVDYDNNWKSLELENTDFPE